MANRYLELYQQVKPVNLWEAGKEGYDAGTRSEAGKLASDGNWSDAGRLLMQRGQMDLGYKYDQIGSQRAEAERKRLTEAAEAERRKRMAGYLQSGDYGSAQGVAVEAGDAETVLKLGDRRTQAIGDALQGYHDRTRSIAALPPGEREKAWGELIEDLKNDNPLIVGDPSFYKRYDTLIKPGALTAYLDWNARQKGVKLEEPKLEVEFTTLGDGTRVAIDKRSLKQVAQYGGATPRKWQEEGDGDGGVKLSTAVSIGQGYNDDIEKIQTGLGNLRTSIPYAEKVVRSNGKPEVANRRSSDVALLRAASRAQTGPGVLTSEEVYQTLSPSIQQQLANMVAYTKIADNLSREDRKALADYVLLGAKTAAGDWYRRYESTTTPLANYGVKPEDVGILGPEVIHPDDFESFLRMPESDFVAGRAYTGPSNRRYQYFGNGRWQYLGQNAYDPSLAMDRQRPAAQASPGSLRRAAEVPAAQRSDNEQMILGNGKIGTWDKDANNGRGAFIAD
jgi:hypothetical protein